MWYLYANSTRQSNWGRGWLSETVSKWLELAKPLWYRFEHTTISQSRPTPLASRHLQEFKLRTVVDID